MKISLVAAMSISDHVIGKDNKIPWKLPSDMKMFKELTSGKAVVMGRKTFESIGRPLPNRTNIVITRNTEYNKHPKCLYAHSIEEAIEISKNLEIEHLMVIGGSNIYEEFMNVADELLLTFVLGVFDGDTFFPSANSFKEFKMIECSDPIKEEKDEFYHVFCKYTKK